MVEHKVHTIPTYYISYNGDIESGNADINFGISKRLGTTLITGKENMEIYIDEQDWRRRLHLFGFSNEQIDKRIENG